MEEQIITYKQTCTLHRFHCDECNKYLGTTEEYDDGYYQKLGELQLKFYLPYDWYKVEKCLCKECRNKYIENLKENLKGIGFVRGK